MGLSNCFFCPSGSIDDSVSILLDNRAMNDSTLCPPNSQWLSDGVIGDVLQRSSLRRSSFQSSAASYGSPIPTLPHLHAVARFDESNDNSGAAKNTAAPAPLFKLAKTTKKAKGSCRRNQGVDEVERRRQRNREHQARHKMKQKMLVANLEGSIQHLKEEIQELELKQLIAYGVRASNDVWGIAAEFFRLFRNSVDSPDAAVETRALCRPKNHIQRDFLLATMTSDVTDGDVYGVDALMENWAMQSQCYQEIDLQPVRLENGPGGVMLATTRGTLVINENTVRYSFPHLLVGNEAERWSTLAEKMVGQTLELRGSVEFEWDEASGRVTCVRCKADILTPLLRLLGSLDDVSHVFDKARLSPDGRLV